MKFQSIVWLRQIVDKLALKHSVDIHEVEEALNNKPRIRFVEKGERKGEDVYMATGQTMRDDICSCCSSTNRRNKP